MNRPPRGFTLIEVLVALAIIAIALIGVVNLTGQTADSTRALEHRLHAQWMAQNQLALARALRDWPEPGNSTQSADMSGDRFSVRRIVSATPNPNFRKLEIEVLPHDGENPLIRLNTLLVNPAHAPAASGSGIPDAAPDAPGNSASPGT